MSLGICVNTLVLVAMLQDSVVKWSEWFAITESVMLQPNTPTTRNAACTTWKVLRKIEKTLSVFPLNYRNTSGSSFGRTRIITVDM